MEFRNWSHTSPLSNLSPKHTNKQTKTKLKTFKTITEETFSSTLFADILEDVKSKLNGRKKCLRGFFFYEMETLHLFYERHKYSDLLDWKTER